MRTCNQCEGLFDSQDGHGFLEVRAEIANKIALTWTFCKWECLIAFGIGRLA